MNNELGPKSTTSEKLIANACNHHRKELNQKSNFLFLFHNRFSFVKTLLAGLHAMESQVSCFEKFITTLGCKILLTHLYSVMLVCGLSMWKESEGFQNTGVELPCFSQRSFISVLQWLSIKLISKKKKEETFVNPPNDYDNVPTFAGEPKTADAIKAQRLSLLL